VPLNRSPGRLRFDSNPQEKLDRSDERVIELAAVRMLTGRELSAGDIRRKLQARHFDSAAIDAVITRLSEKGLLSDTRFVGAFIREHSQRGHGPGRIRAELRHRGVASEVIDEHLRTAEVDWDAIAAKVRARKFRDGPSSRAERAKQSRFLQYRGFTTEQIRSAMGKLCAASTVDIDVADDAELDL
jgi:regulatory protein